MANEPMVVWDGGTTINIPPSMGTPREDQLVGTVYEKLGELAGRICYDSLGTGRPSQTRIDHVTKEPTGDVSVGYVSKLIPKTIEGYHDHIHATRNYSVMEHGAFTIRVIIPAAYGMTDALACLLNRTTLHVIPCLPGLSGQRELRITMNIRHVIDWLSHGERHDRRVRDSKNLQSGIGTPWHHGGSPVVKGIAGAVIMAAKAYAPYFMKHEPDCEHFEFFYSPPMTDDERWVSMYLYGSRGFTHEQVRHGDWTAISQRSTRYVDESESEWVTHPLIEAYWKECEAAGGVRDTAIVDQSRAYYKGAAAALEPWLIARGVDKATARKQARGAARGYLGNALSSEMIFSASVAQWRWMIHERLSPFADAEIRAVYAKVLPALQACRYGYCFGDMSTIDSPDGMGKVLQMAGPREEWRHRI